MRVESVLHGEQPGNVCYLLSVKTLTVCTYRQGSCDMMMRGTLLLLSVCLCLYCTTSGHLLYDGELLLE